MKWIDAVVLERWASTLSARSVFPELIADLIRATAKEIQSIRFPSGNKGQVRGFDGWLQAIGVPPYVPDGLSIWEFGVSGATAAKAFADFTKRTSEVAEDQQKNSTFVFATPYTWDNPKCKLQDWVANLKRNSKWKNIIYLDGVQIEKWLQSCAGVSARYASEMLAIPQEGVQSTDEFWMEYIHQFKVPLTEDVLLCGREEQANSLLQGLLHANGPIQLAADAPDEVIAFAIAAVRKAEWETRLFLENRILVLDTEYAARVFTRNPKRNYIFFPRRQANSLSGQLSNIGPTLIALGRDQSNSLGLFLNRPSTSDFAKALQSLELSEADAYNLAHHSSRSIVVLARQFAAGHASTPEWVTDGENLVPAILAGSWDGASTADCALVESLVADNNYSRFEGGLRKLAKLQDPPIDIEGPIWKIRAPVDAFVQLAHLISKSDLERLNAAAQIVFSELDTPIDPDAPYELSSNASRKHSSWLRDGIANTLLQFAVLSKQAAFNVPGINPQEWVEKIIAGIPGLTSDHRLIASMKSELWMLMEAAPRPLLSALEELLEGDGAKAVGFFSSGDALFAPTSSHIYVLWALETLAWDPNFLGRVSIILAKLAAIDPGGETTNRPINSLCSILSSWAPNTNASLEQRLQVIDRTIEAVPEVSWDILMNLLPRSHNIIHPTRKPKFREAGASQQEKLTYARVWKTEDHVIDRVLDHVTNSSARWVDVINKLDDWSLKQRTQAFSAVDNWLTLTDQSTKAVWFALNELLNKHMAFADAEWAMKRDELTALQDIVRRHQADDVVERVNWLFKRWSVEVGKRFDENAVVLKQLRTEALDEILALDDQRELLRLVDTVGCAEAVAASLSDMVTEPKQISSWIQLFLNHGALPTKDFTRVLSARGYDRFGAEWREQLTASASNEYWSDETVANLILNWPDNEETWEYAANFSLEVKRLYWANKYPFELQIPVPASLEAIENYLDVARPEAALQASYSILHAVPTDTLLVILTRLLEADVSQNLTHMSGYYIERVFTELDMREDLQMSDLAQMEYAFLPFLLRRSKKLVIHKLMAQSPEFYMSLIESVFAPANSEEKTPKNTSEEQKNKWRNQYRLLSEFIIVPGSEGQNDVDYDKLLAWVSEVRELSANSDRVVITDLYIGHMLAHAPADSDESWPHMCVRRLLDKLGNVDVERGVMTERFNMRGVYSKSLYEGGDQERAIAKQYRDWAEASAAFPTTALMLQRMAERYDNEALSEDESARLDKLRYM